MKTAALLLLVLMPMTNLPAQNTSPGATNAEAAATTEYNSVVDQYFDAYFHFHPSEGTAAGFHQYDNMLED